LLKYGANPHTKDGAGTTPLHAAAFANSVDAIEILLKYGANPYARDYMGRRPIDLTSDPQLKRKLS